MGALLFGTFVASLVGSLHCVGMCGGLVAAYSGMGRQRWQLHGAFQGARLLVYTILGALAGTVGATVDLAGAALGLADTAMVLAGATMILGGLAVGLRAMGVGIPTLSVTRGAPRWFGAVSAQLRERSPAVRAALLGITTGLLPCGWLWAFVVAAAGTQTPLTGALVMAAFWAGATPALTGLGAVVQLAARKLGPHVATAGALAVMVLGVVTLTQRAEMRDRFLGHLSEQVAVTEPTLEPAAPAPGPSVPTEAAAPCCHGGGE